MRAAIYARCSTKGQDEETQLIALRQLCQQRGWEAVEYVDHGISGTRADRPALNQMLADAARGRFQCVIVWRFDRMARSVAHMLKVLETLRACNVGFISHQESIDTSTALGKAMFTIVAAFAALERDTICDRVNAGVAVYRDAYKAGKVGTERHSRSGKDLPHGRPRRVFDRDRAREMRLSGASISQISREMGVGKGTVARAVA